MTMNKISLVTATCALMATVLAPPSIANGNFELIYSGPVESVNAPSGELSVLGHHVVASESSTVSVGALVNVYGRLLPNGTVVNPIV